MASNLRQRVVAGWARFVAWQQHSQARPPVDVNDPMGGALSDGEVLIAFAAQDRRSIDETKVLAYTTAAARVADVRSVGSRPTPAEATAFWTAYNALAVQNAPMSAHSVRTSIKLNRKRFAAALATPTAVTGLLALLVFYACLSLQGFWVAGKELIERAEALDKGKSELATEIGRNAADLARARSGMEARFNELARLGAWPGSVAVSAQKTLDNPRAAALHAQLQMSRTALDELRLQADTLNKRLDAISSRSRPLETLMLKWHERAGKVCNWRPLGLQVAAFMCPVEVLDIAAADGRGALRKEIEELEGKLKSASRKSDSERFGPRGVVLQGARGALPGVDDDESAPDWSRFAYLGPHRMDQIELQEKRQKLARDDADHFNRIISEVRMITANLGAYLIALTMGLLGALTFIMRSLSQQLREHTYVPVPISEMLVRLCLGAIAGVFGSLLASSGDPAFKSLPPMFIPFVFGYGIEILFSMLDRVVRSFTQADNAQGVSGTNRA